MKYLINIILFSNICTLNAQIDCATFRTNKNVILVYVSPQTLLGFGDQDVVFIPSIAFVVEQTINKHWCLGLGGGVGINKSLTDPINIINDRYWVAKFDAKYYPSWSLNKWWYGLKLTTYKGKEYPTAPLPTIEIGYSQYKSKHIVRDFSAGILILPSVVLINFGVSWGRIVSKNKHVK